MGTNREDALEAINDRLGRIESKLDDHLERVSKAEVSINWIQGHLKIATAIVLSAISGMAAIIFNIILKGTK